MKNFWISKKGLSQDDNNERMQCARLGFFTRLLLWEMAPPSVIKKQPTIPIPNYLVSGKDLLQNLNISNNETQNVERNKVYTKCEISKLLFYLHGNKMILNIYKYKCAVILKFKYIYKC